MCRHLQVQEIAQTEIDRVVGSDRLPDFSDRKHLPYINAVILEVIRWQPATALGRFAGCETMPTVINRTPIGLPHASIADDEYGGYRIPEGSIVMGNVWCAAPMTVACSLYLTRLGLDRSILHDPETYPKPEEFRPSRFLKMNSDGMLALNERVRDPRSVIFGFGQRCETSSSVCPNECAHHPFRG